MGYKALNLPAQQIKVETDNFDVLGENGLQPAEFQRRTALLIENVIIETETSISKRLGQVKEIEQGTTAVVGGLNWKGNKYFSQDDKLYVNDGTLGGNTLIHTYAGTGQATYATFGDYMYSANGSEEPVEISRTLPYINGTVAFTVLSILTDGVTGATATVFEKSGTTATGTLTIGNIVGEFGANAITDAAGGSADSTGAVGWTSTLLNAPVCGGVFVHDERLVLYKIVENPSQVKYSQQFDSLSATPYPPFEVFEPSSDPPLTTDAGATSFSNAGDVTTMLKLPVGNQLISLYKDGEAGVVIDKTNIDTVGLRQTIRIDFQGEGLGADNAVATRDSIIIVNEGGVWSSQIEVNTAYPFSLTASKASRLFSKELTDEIDFTGSSMIFDEDNDRVYIFCKKGASFNNFTLVVYVGMKTVDEDGELLIPYSRITGWYINSAFKVGREIWGTSAIDGRIFRLFDGNSDDGNVISSRYRQEMTKGDVNSLKEMSKLGMVGEFSENQTIRVSFDIYDQIGQLQEDFVFEDFETGDYPSTTGAGIGKSAIGKGAIGSSQGSTEELKYQWYNRLVGIYEYTRLIMDITEESTKAWKITYINTFTSNKGINLNQR